MSKVRTDPSKDVKSLLALVLATLVLVAPATSATIDQLLPWLAPNSLGCETSFSDFAAAHPAAQDISFNEQQPGKPFNGGKFEELPNGSAFLYGFRDDKLASFHWASGSRVNIAERLHGVRNALIRVHGQPTVETGARVDSHGSIARIIREVYRPTIEKDCVICLMGTSEGVEVALTNEAVQRKHGVKTTRETYEEAARAVSAVIQPNEKPSELVDYLAAERKRAEPSQPEAKPDPTTPPPATAAAATPVASASMTTPVAKTPAGAAERHSPVWPWLVGILALIVIVAVVLKRRT